MNSRFLALTAIFSSLSFVACGGGDSKESVEYVPLIKKKPSTAQGKWNGTTNTNRAISGVVTDENNYWLVYSQQGDHSIPSGFYTGQAGSLNGNFTQTIGLRKFEFAGGDTKQGTLTSATYTQSEGYTSANTLAGTFEHVQVGNIYNITAVGTKFFASATGNINFTYAGTYDGTTKAGTLSGDIFVVPYDLTVTTVSPFTMDPATGKGTVLSAASCDDHGTGTCSSFSAKFKGPTWNGITFGGTPQTSTATPFTLASGSYLWSMIIVAGQDSNFNNIYDTIPLTVNLTAQSLPSITDEVFTTNYDAEFEVKPSLTTIAGNYTAGFSGINSTMHADASLTVTSTGTITGTESASYCNYSATITPHASGNVYDVTNIAFTNAAGGTCVYTGVTFSGAAIYESSTHKLIITATNLDRDKGFIVVASN